MLVALASAGRFTDFSRFSNEAIIQSVIEITNTQKYNKNRINPVKQPVEASATHYSTVVL